MEVESFEEFEKQVADTTSKLAEVIRGKETGIVLAAAGEFYASVLQTFIIMSSKEELKKNIKHIEDNLAIITNDLTDCCQFNLKQTLDSQ